MMKSTTIALKGRRGFLLGLAVCAGLSACGTAPSGSPSEQTPIVFVHGNGDTAALWLAQFWRFESNGYERRNLHAIDFTNPLARSDDSKAQPSRSSTEDARKELAVFVENVKRKTGAQKVALVANSRGANTVRNYVKNGGAAHVSHAVLSGGVNHGVFVMDANTGSEFNGKSTFMQGLNAPNADGTEVTPGVKWMTIRSDKFDKFAQPDGRYIGQPGVKTNIGFDAPSLKGAEDVVLPGADHREVAFNALAFAEMFRHITGSPPKTVAISPEETVLLNGKLTGFNAGVQTNLPLVGGQVSVYAVDAATGKRLSGALLQRKVAEDGLWGPVSVTAGQALEFEIEAQGYATTHIYRSPFLRSSEIVHLRPAAPGVLSELNAPPKPGGAVDFSWVTITRPRGYFGQGRDQFGVDGQTRAINDGGVPTDSTQRCALRAPTRGVVAQFNGERIAVQNWPLSEKRVVFAEFHY